MMLVYFLYPVTWQCVYSLSVCGGVQGNACCAGSYWNEGSLSCEKCLIGYEGMDCSERCTFPSYGEDCQSTCNCDLNFCSYRIGCINDAYDATTIHNTSSHSSGTEGHLETSPLFPKIIHSNQPSETPDLQYTIMFTAIAFVGIIVILCGLFVGIYFYKHCMKRVVIIERKGGNSDPEGYSSLGANNQHQMQHLRETTYLEPVTAHDGQYDEIKEQDELSQNLAVNLSATNEIKHFAQLDLPSTLPHSESFPFPFVVNRNTSGHLKRNIFSTNSL